MRFNLFCFGATRCLTLWWPFKPKNFLLLSGSGSSQNLGLYYSWIALTWWDSHVNCCTKQQQNVIRVLHDNRVKFPKSLLTIVLYIKMATMTSGANQELESGRHFVTWIQCVRNLITLVYWRTQPVVTIELMGGVSVNMTFDLNFFGVNLASRYNKKIYSITVNIALCIA